MSANPNPIKVVVAEDEYFTREGIVRILNEAPGIKVVGQAASGEETLARVKALQPDVLLLDIRMPPGIDGIEVIKRLRAAGQELMIIALTSEKRVARAVEMAGANGFLPKDKYAMFIPTVMCVAQHRSNVFISPEVSRSYQQLLDQVEQAGLSDLERQVWGLIAFKNEEIARRLHKAPGRIRNIVADIYFKLNIHDSGKVSQRVQALQMAERLGILVAMDEVQAASTV